MEEKEEALEAKLEEERAKAEKYKSFVLNCKEKITRVKVLETLTAKQNADLAKLKKDKQDFEQRYTKVDYDKLD